MLAQPRPEEMAHPAEVPAQPPAAVADVPIAAYQVSGEYAMIKFGGLAGVVTLEDLVTQSMRAHAAGARTRVLTAIGPEQ